MSNRINMDWKSLFWIVVSLLSLVAMALAGPVLMIASYFLESWPLFGIGCGVSALSLIFIHHLFDARRMEREARKDPAVIYHKPWTPESLAWMGFWFYTVHPGFLFSQLTCYLWRGHLMRHDPRNDEGRVIEYKQHDGVTEDFPGSYVCEFCGQVMAVVEKEQ